MLYLITQLCSAQSTGRIALLQNRERTGVPKRAFRLGWWLRADPTLNSRNYCCSPVSSKVGSLIRSLPLPVL